jgi:hypothetical protein
MPQPMDFSEFGGVREDAQPTQTATVGQSAPAPQAAQPSIDFSEFGGVREDVPQPAEQPGLIERAGNFLTKVHEQGPVEVGKGLLKGAGDTLLGVSELAQKAQPGAALAKLVSPSARENQKHFEQFSEDAHATLETKNEAQEAGKGLEFVAEMFLGDGAFKALTSLEKIRTLKKAADILDKYPTIGKILQRSITAGASAGTIEGVKTQDAEKAIEAAAIGGVTGGLFEGGSAAGKKAFEVVPKATKKIVSSVWDSVSGKAIQSDLQSGIRGTLEATAKDAEVATVRSGAQPAIRNSAKSVAESVEAKSKALYQQIDDATAGRFTNAERELKNVNRKLREVAGTDDALEEKLFEKKLKLEADFEDLFEMAKREGVKPEVADAARSSWKRSQALRDVDAQIKASTFGEGKHAAEVVDPNKLVTRLQKLQDSGRLEEALGEEQADALLKKAYDAVDAAKGHAKNVTRAKTAAKYTAIGTGALGGLKVLGGE